MHRFERWITILTNIGVLAGLLLVALQISQTNEALDRENRQWQTDISFSTNEMYSNFSVLAIENADVWRRGKEGKKLDETEEVIFDILATQFIWANVQVYQVSIQSEGEADNYAPWRVAQELQGSPGLKEFFDQWVDSHGYAGSAFVKDVRAELANVAT